MSESFSKQQNFTGVKKNLLKGSNFKSIQQARREYPNLSDNEIYQNLLETILRKDRQQRKRKENKRNSILPFRNSEIEPLGQPVRKQNRTELIPYNVNIEISGDTFLIKHPKNSHSFGEVLTEGLEGKGPLIVSAKTPEEARKKPLKWLN